MAEVLVSRDGRAISENNPLPVSIQGGQCGQDGKSIEFEWKGTQLGIRQEGSEEYEYQELKGDKGDPGEKGDPGTDGTDGKDGSDGVGILDIEYDDVAEELVFTMTDESEKRVPFPRV